MRFLRGSSPRVSSLHVTSLAIAMCLSCLPRDSRPVPGNLTMTVEASDATANGFVTSDGWTIHFVRVVTAVGTIRLDNYPDHSTSCNDYYETNYDRVFDFRRLTAPAKIGIVYGLGKCSVGYRFRAPMETDLVETGATAADVTAMRTEQMDTSYKITGRTSLIVLGSAERNGTIKTFDWEFRHNVNIDKCASATGSGFDSVLDLKGNQALSLAAEIRAEELFRAAPRDDAPFVFDPIASADANGLGFVSLDNLTGVPAPPGSTSTTGGMGGGGAGGSGTGGEGGSGVRLPASPTLGDVIYQLLLPRVSRIKGSGPCSTSARPSG
jgi:hypothetical protein